MNTRKREVFSFIELLTVIAIVAILAAILFPLFSQANVRATKRNVDKQDMRKISLAVLLYADDNDDKFPRTGADCQGYNSDPIHFAPGEQNQCGGDGWQDAVGPYVTGEEPGEAFLTPSDFSEAGIGSWGFSPGTNFNTTDDNLSFLMNDRLSHRMPTKVGGYADPLNEDLKSNGLSPDEIKRPSECIMLTEGHGGWDNVSGAAPGTAVITDWTGSTDLQNKWHHEYDLTINCTFFMSAASYDGTRLIQIGLPFYKNGGLVAFADGHQKFVPYSNPDGTPILCSSLPWARNIDPQQRNAKLDSCNDPNNPVAAGIGQNNWF